ncbi:MAG: response regulator [Archangiaceae bacterium]|nr:response regulator [Archangiaceae bacterium]
MTTDTTHKQAARRILVVDDEEGVTSALRRSLRREGYEIATSNDPKEALVRLKTETFDLLISDHLMPGMTGTEFTKICRDRYPDMMRLMLTGQPETQMVIKAINEGEVYRFVTKPWDDLELKVTLWMAFEQLDLVRENRRLLTLVRRQQGLIDKLERDNPGITTVMRDETGAILIDAT